MVTRGRVLTYQSGNSVLVWKESYAKQRTARAALELAILATRKVVRDIPEEG